MPWTVFTTRVVDPVVYSKSSPATSRWSRDSASLPPRSSAAVEEIRDRQHELERASELVQAAGIPAHERLPIVLGQIRAGQGLAGIVRWGVPTMAAHTPQRSSRPGDAAPGLDTR